MIEQKLNIVVPDELNGFRLDQALSILCPQHSRTRLQRWIKAGNVTVNNKTLRQRDFVESGERIELVPVYETTDSWSAEDIPFDIIHEDDEIIVINKPVGLVVHPGAGNTQHTLLNALLYYNSSLELVPRAGIIQRLDKDTSGIMVIARTSSSHTYLVDQLQKRLIVREYQAIVSGVMTAGGFVDASIGRHPVHRTRMAVVTKGKSAITHYRIIAKYSAHTLIQLKLESGRTHQIRVHMSHIKYPIVGDPVYGGRTRLPKNTSECLREAIRTFPRQALHASSLGLVHPKTGEMLSWQAVIPADIQSLLDILRDEYYSTKI